MTKEDADTLVGRGYAEYRLREGDRQLHPNTDEVVVFFDFFTTGLVITCHEFVNAVVERY